MPIRKRINKGNNVLPPCRSRRLNRLQEDGSPIRSSLQLINAAKSTNSPRENILNILLI